MGQSLLLGLLCALFPAARASPPPPLAASLWPLPRRASFGAVAAPLSPSFSFSATAPAPAPANGSEALLILEAAFARSYGILGFGGAAPGGGAPFLEVLPASLDDTLQLGVDESYTLAFPSDGGNGTLACATVYGCLRGLETFSQLVARDVSTGRRYVTGAPLAVADAPRFPHRGALVDTSRHFLPVATLRAVVDGLAFDKANVLHWHISDAQAQPFASVAVPGLGLGAWAPAATYSAEDLRGVVAYAKYRGVRVVPEIDQPAHCQSWGVGRPDIVIPCGYGSVLDPTKEATYGVLAALLGELAAIFFDDALHVGFDEVDVSSASCYNTSAVRAWMPSQNISAGDFKGVVRYHMGRVMAIVRALGKRPSAWQEAADHYGAAPGNPTWAPRELDPDTALHMWLAPAWEWWNTSFAVAEPQAFRAVKSYDWYLSSPGLEWADAYASDPLTDAVCQYNGTVPTCTCTQKPDPAPYGCFNITEPSQVARVLGGEASVWGEAADEANVLQLLWPRASAVAERLWSDPWVNDAAQALPRLVDHRCRLVARGIPAAPVAPGWCDGGRG